MAQAVAPSPEVTLKTNSSTFKGLLNFGSVVTLINESFFQSNLAQSITPMTGDKVNAHQLFNLKGVENGQVPLSKYFEMDVEIRRFKIPQVGFLVKRDKAPLVDSKGKKTKLPAIAGCNLIILGMEEFIRVHGVNHLIYLSVQLDLIHFCSQHFVFIITPSVKEKKRKKAMKKIKYTSV